MRFILRANARMCHQAGPWLCKQGRGQTAPTRPDTQVHCGDAAVEKKVEDKISQLYSWVEKHPGKKAQVGPAKVGGPCG
jgi:hypothetical protein